MVIDEIIEMAELAITQQRIKSKQYYNKSKQCAKIKSHHSNRRNYLSQTMHFKSIIHPELRLGRRVERRRSMRQNSFCDVISVIVAYKFPLKRSKKIVAKIFLTSSSHRSSVKKCLEFGIKLWFSKTYSKQHRSVLFIQVYHCQQTLNQRCSRNLMDTHADTTRMNLLFYLTFSFSSSLHIQLH